MQSDLIKTIAGLITIGVIVVATFMYGNAQREAQQRRDQDLKQSQQAVQSSASPVASATPAASPKVAASPASGTAAVTSPSPNTIQGGKGGAVASPSPTPTPKATTTPVAGASTAALPETGPELASTIAVGAMVVAFGAYRRSRQAIPMALRMRGRA